MIKKNHNTERNVRVFPSELLNGSWLFGRFEGHFERAGDQIRVVRGVIHSSHFTKQPPIATADDIIQSTLPLAWVEFAADASMRTKENKVQSVVLHDLVFSECQLEDLKVVSGVSYGHIHAVVWAKCQPSSGSKASFSATVDEKNSPVNSRAVGKLKQLLSNKQSSPWLLLPLLLFLLLANLFSSDSALNFNPKDDLRRVFSPLLPVNDGLVQSKENDKSNSDISIDENKNSLANLADIPVNGWLLSCDQSLKLKSEVLFEFGRANLLPEASETLKSTGSVFEKIRLDGTIVKITGHTDSYGEQDYNLKLSWRRAEAIADWYIQQGLMTKSQVLIQGKGEFELIINGSKSKDEQSENRRVEISLVCDRNKPITVTERPIAYFALLEEIRRQYDIVFLSEITPTQDPELVSDLDSKLMLLSPFKGIVLEEALVEPEIFFNSCGRPLLLSSDLLFDYSRAGLKVSALKELNLIAQLLKESTDSSLRLKIIGHTDSHGNDQFNLRLSYRRANRVARWLVENDLIKKDHLVIEGRGEKDLMAPATGSIEEQNINRRVEITVICSSKKLELKRMKNASTETE